MKLLDSLILQFSKLPRVGKRAATRIVISILSDKTGIGVNLAQALTAAMDKIKPCKVCGCLSENELCEYCSDKSRETGQLCIVRDFSDVSILEKSGIFRGRYHIIGGLLSGANGITPDDLNIHGIAKRIKEETIKEIIFALPNTMDGKTTGGYISHSLCNENAEFCELASGVPFGGDLDYLDDGTLALAFMDRKKLKS